MQKYQFKGALEKSGITMGELAERLGYSKQNLFMRIKRNKFTDDELKQIAEILGCKYVCYFEFQDGTKI